MYLFNQQTSSKPFKKVLWWKVLHFILWKHEQSLKADNFGNVYRCLELIDQANDNKLFSNANNFFNILLKNDNIKQFLNQILLKIPISLTNVTLNVKFESQLQSNYYRFCQIKALKIVDYKKYPKFDILSLFPKNSIKLKKIWNIYIMNLNI